MDLFYHPAKFNGTRTSHAAAEPKVLFLFCNLVFCPSRFLTTNIVNGTSPGERWSIGTVVSLEGVWLCSRVQLFLYGLSYRWRHHRKMKSKL